MYSRKKKKIEENICTYIHNLLRIKKYVSKNLKLFHSRTIEKIQGKKKINIQIFNKERLRVLLE